MIPEAAIEAAARGMHAAAHPPERWDSRPDHQQIYRARARAALEAASPHMGRYAYDMGYLNGVLDIPNSNPPAKHSMHEPGGYFYACEACSGLPDGDRQ